MVSLISGITGQDSFYLAEFLLAKGYEVHGTARRVSGRTYKIPKGVIVHYATLENYGSLYRVVEKVKPDEVYHLAAQSFVTNSFDDEFSTMSMNIHGTHYLLNAVKEIVPKAKFYFAATSEMFGNAPEPQDEETPMNPVSPYGISKLACFHLCHYYRDVFNMFVSCGILFNHESPQRGDEFVTKKICNAAKNRQYVSLGNLEARRDWGYAGDYVEAMWLMLQQEEADDFVISTGITHSVGELAELAYKEVGLNYKDYVSIDPKFYRANELHALRGDATKALFKLGWSPSMKFEQLVKEMMK
jgi:GDPmannose 4,6-dehydratase